MSESDSYIKVIGKGTKSSIFFNLADNDKKEVDAYLWNINTLAEVWSLILKLQDFGFSFSIPG